MGDRATHGDLEVKAASNCAVRHKGTVCRVMQKQPSPATSPPGM
jgi:hypothetical protein